MFVYQFWVILASHVYKIHINYRKYAEHLSKQRSAFISQSVSEIFHANGQTKANTKILINNALIIYGLVRIYTAGEGRGVE